MSARPTEREEPSAKPLQRSDETERCEGASSAGVPTATAGAAGAAVAPPSEGGVAAPVGVAVRLGATVLAAGVELTWPGCGSTSEAAGAGAAADSERGADPSRWAPEAGWPEADGAPAVSPSVEALVEPPASEPVAPLAEPLEA